MLSRHKYFASLACGMIAEIDDVTSKKTIKVEKYDLARSPKGEFNYFPQFTQARGYNWTIFSPAPTQLCCLWRSRLLST